MTVELFSKVELVGHLGKVYSPARVRWFGESYYYVEAGDIWDTRGIMVDEATYQRMKRGEKVIIFLPPKRARFKTRIIPFKF